MRPPTPRPRDPQRADAPTGPGDDGEAHRRAPLQRPGVVAEEGLRLGVAVVAQASRDGVPGRPVRVAVKAAADARREAVPDLPRLRHPIEAGDLHGVDEDRLPLDDLEAHLHDARLRARHHRVDRCIDEPVVAIPDGEAQQIERELVRVETVLEPHHTEGPTRPRRWRRHDAGRELRVAERRIPAEAQRAHLHVAALAPRLLRPGRRRDTEGQGREATADAAPHVSRPSVRRSRGSTNARGSASSPGASSAPPGSPPCSPRRTPSR